MKLNVKKLDATIAKLQALRRLATDPDLSDFIEITGTKPAPNGSHGAILAEAVDNEVGHGALRANVLAACRALTLSQFTIKEVYRMMGVQSTSNTGTEKSVANVLRLLASEGELSIAVRGQGRRPTAYKNV